MISIFFYYWIENICDNFSQEFYSSLYDTFFYIMRSSDWILGYYVHWKKLLTSQMEINSEEGVDANETSGMRTILPRGLRKVLELYSLNIYLNYSDKIDFYAKYIRINQNLYWAQTTYIQMENVMSKHTIIEW